LRRTEAGKKEKDNAGTRNPQRRRREIKHRGIAKAARMRHSAVSIAGTDFAPLKRKHLVVHEGGIAAIIFMTRAMFFEKTVHGRFENMNYNLHYIKHLADLVIDSLLE